MKIELCGLLGLVQDFIPLSTRVLFLLSLLLVGTLQILQTCILKGSCLLLNNLLPFEQRLTLPPCPLQPLMQAAGAHTPAWHLLPGTHKAGPGPAPRGANSWQAISQPRACSAELQGGGGPGGILMGSLSSKTSALLARRSEGRMQEIQEAGVRAAPTPQLCRALTPTLPRGSSLSLSCLSFSLPPTPSWHLGKDKYLKQSCLLEAVPA